MWAFAISLLLVSFYPESLLMPGVYGFLQGLSVVVFGTIVGDWVDFNPRLRGEGTVGGVWWAGCRRVIEEEEGSGEKTGC